MQVATSTGQRVGASAARARAHRRASETTVLLLVLARAVSVRSSATEARLETGDLLFVRPTLGSTPVDRAILDVGNATISWLRAHGVRVPTDEVALHVALAWRNESAGGALFFVEATPPVVQLTPAAAFFRGWGATTTFYRGRHRAPAVRQRAPSAARVARAVIGKPYSFDFAPPPATFYCSSLVVWAYGRAVGGSGGADPDVFVDEPFALIFVPRAFWADYYAKMHLTLPPANTTGSNPTLLLHSPHVEFAPFAPPTPLAHDATDNAARGVTPTTLTDMGAVRFRGSEVLPAV